MNKLFIFAVIAVLAGPAHVTAQDSAPEATPAPSSLTLEDPEPNASKPDDPGERSKADKWRSEVLDWKNARRVEEGTVSHSIKELSRSVLVLGTVNGDVSTVAGNVAVLGRVNGNVSSVSGTVTVLGTVKGKASVVGGNLRVAGKVTGDTSVVGGTLETLPGGQVLGNSNSVGRHGMNLNFNHGGNWHRRFNSHPGGFVRAFWLSPFMLVWRSGLLILWVALGCAIAALFQPALLRAQNELRTAPGRSVAFGVVWTILFWMLLAACLVLCLIVIGVPLLIVLLAFNLALGAFGMTLTFSIVGEWIARRLNHPNASLYAAVFAGACLLGLLRLIPVVGSLIWFAAGLFGIGATLAARFGIANHAPPSAPTLPPLVTA